MAKNREPSLLFPLILQEWYGSNNSNRSLLALHHYPSFDGIWDNKVRIYLVLAHFSLPATPFAFDIFLLRSQSIHAAADYVWRSRSASPGLHQFDYEKLSFSNRR